MKDNLSIYSNLMTSRYLKINMCSLSKMQFHHCFAGLNAAKTYCQY